MLLVKGCVCHSCICNFRSICMHIAWRRARPADMLVVILLEWGVLCGHKRHSVREWCIIRLVRVSVFLPFLTAVSLPSTLVNPATMTAITSVGRGSSDPFLSHLIALLSTYELCPMSTPPPRYDGPTDWQTDTIIRSLGAVARRMYTAEETLTSIRASECWTGNGPETKKRRSNLILLSTKNRNLQM
ncbi:hypothetical protein BJ138DRAFT_751504 [Hygrophoropsis aurantiaca]|uniref:Uncharacterized protein n=1 Tax=Hygrophoropsis aurantiaca TaxID=72124 RepID=A0ACB7ZXD7_9AGAM|nr:hypothetical protein BJ138DRAFT_751504 [Hygrophoropsis aurantiaca]